MITVIHKKEVISFIVNPSHMMASPIIRNFSNLCSCVAAAARTCPSLLLPSGARLPNRYTKPLANQSPKSKTDQPCLTYAQFCSLHFCVCACA